MLRVDFEKSERLFRSQAIPRLLSGARLSHNATYFRIRSDLIEAGLFDGEHYSDSLILNLHDPRLDLALKPKVRRLGVLLENAGPLYLRALARISNLSLQSAYGAIRLLKSSGLIQSTRGMLDFVYGAIVRSDPLDEIPNPEYKACFMDVVKGLKSKCSVAVLMDNLGKDRLKVAKVLVLVEAGLEGPLGRLSPTLLELANNIHLGHGVQLHFTIANEIHMMSFLNAKRGVWPIIFARAAQGVVIIGNLRHDGRSLFESAQKVLTYPQPKIEEFVKSGTLVKQDDGFAFSDVGIRRYVRLTRIPTLEQVNSTISALL